MSLKECLVCKGFPYAKISAIKDVGHEWGKGELDENNFKVVTIDISELQVWAWENHNAICFDDLENPKGLVDTPKEFQYIGVSEDDILNNVLYKKMATDTGVAIAELPIVKAKIQRAQEAQAKLDAVEIGVISPIKEKP